MPKESLQKKVGRVRPPRVQITYDVEVGDAIEVKELPFVMGVLADLTGQPEQPLPRLKDRKFVEVNPDNFDSVLEAMKPHLSFSVENKLSEDPDAGQLKVIIRDGRMVIQLESDVLFDSGKTNIKPDGQTALAKLAPVLAGITDRKYLVTGFTDDVPIHTQRFPSNWELSTARAVEVVKFLVASGLNPQQVAAAGYSEFDPVVANDAPEHRAQNRRIEIVLQPNLSDLPSLDNLQSVAK